MILGSYMARKLIEQRRRGPIGSLVKWASWGIHIIFAYLTYMAFSGNYGEIDPQFAGGDTVAVGIMVLIAWGFTAIVLAFINFLFRGRREYVEIDSEGENFSK